MGPHRALGRGPPRVRGGVVRVLARSARWRCGRGHAGGHPRSLHEAGRSCCRRCRSWQPRRCSGEGGPARAGRGAQGPVLLGGSAGQCRRRRPAVEGSPGHFAQLCAPAASQAVPAPAGAHRGAGRHSGRCRGGAASHDGSAAGGASSLRGRGRVTSRGCARRRRGVQSPLRVATHLLRRCRRWEAAVAGADAAAAGAASRRRHAPLVEPAGLCKACHLRIGLGERAQRLQGAPGG
mmetsp:Transcript_4684/g.19980  ORF Transcript_4684/g.19980 Transcript_4684/m.19980 type:complete len:236 (-) Transcript_4684:1513-2220(-)